MRQPPRGITGEQWIMIRIAFDLLGRLLIVAVVTVGVFAGAWWLLS